MKTINKIILEKTTDAFIEEAKKGTPISKLSPQEGRKVLEKVQSIKVQNPDVQVEDKMIEGEIRLKVVRPSAEKKITPALLFIHGGGWVLGSFKTHEHLCKTLSHLTQSTLIFVDYPLSPEARFPAALEQAVRTLKYLSEKPQEFNIDPSRLAIVGDSVGGNMSIAATLLNKERNGPKIKAEVLFYPVTSSDMNTASYEQFADGPWLTRASMEYFWAAYEKDPEARRSYLLSPLNATEEQLKDFPPTLLITDENDVLRDEGEEFARKLTKAGVDVQGVRMLSTVHDFAMLNPLASTPAALTAIKMAAGFLKTLLK
jgi:acetyl esterase